jgi:conjugal transfer/type IV secretion protein DotA/TraY
MINLFQLASDDQSVNYLSQIFGSMNGIIPGGSSLTLLGTMFKTFNTTILAVGALMLVYMTVVGVMATAHEGEFMGKKWNNIWIPIRAVLGIAMMVPTGSGYSALQLVMMWVIIQGIGAADTLWSTVLNYVNIVGSPYSQASLPSTGAANTFAGIFQGLVCDASARMSKADPTNSSNGGYYCNNSSDSFCSSSLTVNPNSTTLSLGPAGTCGTITYCNQTSSCSDPNSISCLACQGQVTALQAIIPTLGGIAQQMVNADYSYRDFYAHSNMMANNPGWQWIYNYCSAQNIPQNQCCIGSDSPVSTCKAASGGTSFPDVNNSGNPQNASDDAVSKIYWSYWPQLGPNLGTGTNFINTAVGYYMNQLQGAYTTYITSQGQNNASGGTIGIDVTKGWIYAGGYYYFLASMTGKSVNNALPDLKYNGPSNIASSVMGGYRNNFNAALTLENAATGSSGNAVTNQVSQPFNSTMSTVSTTFQTSVGNQKNPLVGIQIAGTVLLLAADIAFVVILAVVIAMGIAGDIDIFVLGSGAVDPLGPTTGMVLIFIVPAIYFVLGILITLGGLLSVYTPLIPYLVFTFGAIGWLISTIEAMVAGPLVALGVISPSGHHELLGKAEPALMLLFNIFLRPSLMIFGLIAAMLLANVVLIMINALFWPVVYVSLVETGGSGIEPIGIIMFLSAYVMLIVAALNKCFAVINVIPQQVMRWISGQGEAVETPLGEIKGAVEAAGGKTMGAMQGAGDKGKEYAGTKRGLEQAKTKALKEKQDQSSLRPGS